MRVLGDDATDRTGHTPLGVSGMSVSPHPDPRLQVNNKSGL